jgi:hypothetical protein
MRIALTLLAVSLLCCGCGGGDKFKAPTDVTKIDASQVKISGWGGGADTKPAK